MSARRSKRPVVLVATPVYFPRQGGSSTYFSNLMGRLKGRVDFVVYTCTHPDAQRRELEDGIEVHRIQPFLLDSPKLLRYLVLPPVTLFQMFRLWRRRGPFIIHGHSTGAYGYLYGLFSRIVGQEMLKEVQDMADPPYSVRMGRIHRYVSTGRTIADRLVSFGIDPERIITYPSLNPEIPEEVRRGLKPKPHVHDGKIELLCISALRPYKGVDYLLRSMRIVQKRDPSIHLTVIGEGGMRGRLEEYIEKHGLRNVTLKGFVEDYEDVLRAMAGCDILVLSSVSAEGNPRVILESFQFERPVIATAAGGTSELIEDGVNGRLLPPKDYRAFADAILDMASDGGRRKVYGEAGKRFLRRLPTWDDLADEIYGEYKDIWKRRGK